MEGNDLKRNTGTPKIAVVGLGLIGGSIARRLTEEGCRVTGFDRSQSVVDQAIQEKVIAAGAVWPVQPERSADALLSDCQIVFICTPPEAVADTVPLLRRYTAAILTDAASVKSPVMAQVTDGRFVGGHPMSGSEKTGYAHSSASLLENAVYALCIPADTTLTVPELRFLEETIRLTGATVLEIDADQHDEAVAAVSHLPHIAASALTLLAAAQADENLSRLAAGGFRDITRIASSNPDLWTSISLSSAGKLLPLLAQYIDLLREFHQNLMDGESILLEKFFYQAAMYRASLPVDGRGALVAQSALTVYIKDRPGELGRITTLLGENQINISNIRIKELRAYEGGCLDRKSVV